LIWRIRDRAGFERLTAEGRRVRAGVLWCTFVLDPTLQPPRVAFAIGRAVGPAVVRNRIRRRLRSALLATELTPGLYLIGAAPAAAARSYDELQFDLVKLIDRSRPSRA
jgi:ribonuclease P protein component